MIDEYGVSLYHRIASRLPHRRESQVGRSARVQCALGAALVTSAVLLLGMPKDPPARNFNRAQ